MTLLDKKTQHQFGIVYTPEPLINRILDLIPKHHFANPNFRWLDVGAGTGAFSKNLYNRLNTGLSSTIKNDKLRHQHILTKMLFMVEIFPDHIKELENHFTLDANIIKQNFLTINTNNTTNNTTFDFIIGNPPYNIDGALKTPTNTSLKKSEEGKQVYVEFVKHGLELLNPDGFLNLIIPSLWLKPDKAGLYNILTNKKILKLHCLSTSETNKAFNYKAQTPTCYFLIQNIQMTSPEINIYDKINDTYIPYILHPQYPIPMCGISIINKLLIHIQKTGHIKVFKSNTPSIKSSFSQNNQSNHQYINIKTTLLNKETPVLIKNYSNIPQQFHNKPKLILAHKMYGSPYFDISGEYGISTRDNYIILPTNNDPANNELTNNNDFKQLQAFLSTKFALFIFSSTNYRMRYLEKYAFNFLPDITRIVDFPNLLNISIASRDQAIANYFNFTTIERENIEKHSKNYDFFIL